MRINSRVNSNTRIRRPHRSVDTIAIRNVNRTKQNSRKKGKSQVFFTITALVLTFSAVFYIFFNNSNTFGNNEKQTFFAPTPTPRSEFLEVVLQPGEQKSIKLDDGFKLQEQSIMPNNEAFYSFRDNTLQITPGKSQIGLMYKIEFKNDRNDQITYNLQVKQKDLNFTELEQKITEIVGSESDKYGIYIKDLKRDKVIALNGDKVYPPASVSKVPIAIMALKDIDSGKYTLESTFPMRQSYKIYDFDGMTYVPNGTQVTLDRYISTMLIESDNTAMTGLEVILGGVKSLNNRVKNELGVDTFFRDPHDAKAQDIGLVFENIYKGSYLEKEQNDYLLDKLFNTASRFQDRIQAGVPKESNVKVAHKIGQVTTNVGYSYNDAGIVYGEKTDFVIVVINQQVGEASARDKIVKITEAAYDFMNQ